MLCVSKAEHNGARYDTHFICLVKAPEEILERVYVSLCKLFCETANRVVDTGDHNT